MMSKLDKPKKGVNVFFSAKSINLSRNIREDFPNKIILNVAFGSAEIILPSKVSFIIKGDNHFGKTFLPEGTLYTGEFEYRNMPNADVNHSATIVSSCAIGKLEIKFR